MALGDETRVLLGNPPDVLPPHAHVHGTATVTLNGPAQLELAYGVKRGEGVPPVVFRVSMATGTETSSLLDETVDPGSGGGQWYERTLRLDAHGEVTLQFLTITQTPAAGTSDPRRPVSAWFAEPVVAMSGPSQDRPSVILVSLDTLRADRLGTYGYERGTSPEMDRYFGERGLVVEHCFAQAPNTLESHGSMFSGLLPATAVAPGLKGLHPWVKPLAGTLFDAGYRTAAFTENAFVAAARTGRDRRPPARYSPGDYEENPGPAPARQAASHRIPGVRFSVK